MLYLVKDFEYELLDEQDDNVVSSRCQHFFPPQSPTFTNLSVKSQQHYTGITSPILASPVTLPSVPSNPSFHIQLIQKQLHNKNTNLTKSVTMPPTFSYTLTPTSYYPPSYHPALYYRSSIPSDYLPNDEHRYLVKLQDRSRLESHFAQPSSSSSYVSPHKTAYQEQGNLSREWRTKVSETAYATRAALEPSFDFTDDGYERMQTADNDRYASSRYRDESGHEAYVPSRRVHELSKKYWDDDRKYREARYRKNSYGTYSAIYGDTRSLAHPEPTPPRRERYDSGTGESTVYGPTSELSSTFSWSSSDEDEPPKRRRRGRPRRSREAG